MNIVCRVLLISAFVAVGAFGCAFTKATLNVQYTADNAQKGPLSTIEPLNIEIGDFVDKRKDTLRIGFKRNGYGQQTADIVNARPVAEVVKDALAAELAANGHVFNREPKNVLLTGAVTSFWLDYQVGFWAIEFMGTVSADVTLRDSKTGVEVYSQSYTGHYNEKSLGGLDETWERVMNKALDRMVQQASTDPRLIQVLKALRSTQEPMAATSAESRQ